MKQTINFFRNIAHYLIGFTFLYCIGNATGTNDFWLWQKILGSIVIGGLFGGVIGAFWEFGNKIAFGTQPDMKDILRTAIGGVLGCLTACLFKELHFVTVYLFWFCIVLIVADLIRALIKKYK